MNLGISAYRISAKIQYRASLVSGHHWKLWSLSSDFSPLSVGVEFSQRVKNVAKVLWWFILYKSYCVFHEIRGIDATCQWRPVFVGNMLHHAEVCWFNLNVFPLVLYRLNCELCVMKDKWPVWFWFRVSELSWAVDNFDFYCILLCLYGSDFFLWYGETSILESVKLLNLWPLAVWGRPLAVEVVLVVH